MISFTVGNVRTVAVGIGLRQARLLDKVCSYSIEGAWFSPAFREHRWDGKEHLFRASARLGGHQFPTGLLPMVTSALRGKGIKYRIVNETKTHGPKLNLGFNVKLRPYQKEAVRAVLSPPFSGRGILDMAIRSGKTKMAAGIITKIGRRSLFVVTSKGLLHQTYDALGESISGATIGRIGDGIFRPEDVTVATIQTLALLYPKTKKLGDVEKWKEISPYFDLVVADELHHFTGKGNWHEVLHEVDSKYKVGLSATIFPESKKAMARGAIWMYATCGPIKATAKTSDLIEKGWLMRQHVHLYHIGSPDLMGRGWSPELVKRGITHNRKRNGAIAKIVAMHARKGRKVVVIARRLNHIDNICTACERQDLEVVRVTGRHGQDYRERALEALKTGAADVVVANVLGEGIDVPWLDVVVNAEGGVDDKRTVQRQRNLTMDAGKKMAIFVDFIDETNEHFLRHSRARVKMYEAERAYKVKDMGHAA